MIDQLATCHHQQLRALFYVRKYFGQNGLVIAYDSLLGLYVNMIMLFLWVLKLNVVQKAAEKLYAITHPHHLRYVTDNVFCCYRVLLGSYNLLDVFINSFLGMIQLFGLSFH